MELVGALLKKSRIQKSMSLEDVSLKTNISLGYLEAIEKDDFSLTPGGVYTQGFIINYAKLLNLNYHEIINQYKTQNSFFEEDKPIDLPKTIDVFQSFISYKFFSSIAVISIFIVFYFLFISKSNIDPEFAITPDIPEVLISKIEEFELKNTTSTISKDKDVINFANNTISKSFTSGIYNNTNNITINNQASAIASTPVLDKDKKLISIKAIIPTWIQLRNKENEIIYSKLMESNEEYLYSLKNDYVLTTGNAGNLIISIDGEIMGKLGKKGEILDSLNISKDYFLN